MNKCNGSTTSFPYDIHRAPSVTTPPFAYGGISGIYATHYESLLASLRADGFTEQDVDQVNVAINTLGTFGVNGIGMTYLNEIPSFAAELPDMSNLLLDFNFDVEVPYEGMYTHVNGIREIDGNAYAISQMGSGLRFEATPFQPRRTIDYGILRSSCAITSVSDSNAQYLVEADRLRRLLPSPISSILPFNRNSFGLGMHYARGNSYFKEISHPNAKKVVVYREFDVYGDLMDFTGPHCSYLKIIEQENETDIRISGPSYPIPGIETRFVTICGLRKNVIRSQFQVAQRLHALQVRRARRNFRWF